MIFEAGLAVGDRGDRLQDGAERVPGFLRAARHDRGPVQCALLAARDAGADEFDAGISHRLFVVTDILPVPEEERWDRLTVLPIAPLIARAIHEVFDDGSVASMFDGAA